MLPLHQPQREYQVAQQANVRTGVVLIELGIPNEHLNAKKKHITPDQSMSTSDHLKPAFREKMVELRPAIMVQIAIRLTAVQLRLVYLSETEYRDIADPISLMRNRSCPKPSIVSLNKSFPDTSGRAQESIMVESNNQRLYWSKLSRCCE